MPRIVLPTDQIRNEKTFHAACQRAFGFPDFYAHTMDAWIDCLSYLRDEDRMSKFHLKPNETLIIHISNSEQLRQQAPQIMEELEFCVGVINERYDDYGEKPALKLKLS